MRHLAAFLARVLGACSIALAAPPLPVMDLQIQLADSTHMQLSWSAVVQDTLGQPLLGPSYLVLQAREPYFESLAATQRYVMTVPGALLAREDSLVFYKVLVRAVERPLMTTVPVSLATGIFDMGQTGVATPVHSVTLTHGYELSTCEITNQQYVDALNWALAQGLVSVVGDYVKQYNVNLLRINESGYDRYEIRYDAGTQQFYLHGGTWWDGDFGPGGEYPAGYDPANHPVKNVSWYGAACYCDWLSLMNGLPAYYHGSWGGIPNPYNPYGATGYRLPTEAEWEFAAQFDDERTYPWGSEAPNCALTSFRAGVNYCVLWTSPVGNHPTGANNLGLQDMAGNLWEWNNDWYAPYSSSAQTNPTGPASGTYRVVRGGNWYYADVYLPCARRDFSGPAITNSLIGFRLCRILF